MQSGAHAKGVEPAADAGRGMWSLAARADGFTIAAAVWLIGSRFESFH